MQRFVTRQTLPRPSVCFFSTNLEKDMSESTLQLANAFVSSSPDHHHERRRALSKAITLIESKLPKHQVQANLLLQFLQQQEQNQDQESIQDCFRLGIAGPPGAGKSTFIEAFGMDLLDKHTDTNSKLAVVCIDPSSSLTGGSILGDKTRMMSLSVHPRAYVRPSANGGTFGGLSAYTDDVVSLCRAANYNYIIVESVGLGQSEVEIAKSVDMMLLMIPPSGGDELQGVKKGIMEVADAIVVNKADGTLLQAARRTAADYTAATKFLRHVHEDWPTPPVMLVSAETHTGLDDLWTEIVKFRRIMTENGNLAEKRQEQAHYWMWKNLQNLIAERTKSNEQLKDTAQELQQQLDSGRTTPRVAAISLMECLLRSSGGE